jgi:hypothetical protein
MFKVLIGILLFAAITIATGCSNEDAKSSAAITKPVNPQNSNTTNAVDARYDELLSIIVDEEGWVRYLVLAEPEHTQMLADVVRGYAEAQLPDDVPQRKALWCNAYNANALEFTARAMMHPDFTSVNNVPGFFNEKKLTVAKQEFTLDELKKAIRQFGDPRIHAALVFGARSCPPLRSEAFTPAKLDEQLDHQSRQWIDGHWNVVKNDHLTISEIFKWHESDFAVPPYNSVKEFLRKKSTPNGMMRSFFRNVPDPRVEFTPFRWQLNQSMEETVAPRQAGSHE